MNIFSKQVKKKTKSTNQELQINQSRFYYSRYIFIITDLIYLKMCAKEYFYNFI